VISHTGAAETELFFRQCAKAMTSNTTVLFTFVQGAKNCEEDGWFYPACVTYTPEYMRELADRHGLSIEIVEWPPLNRHEGGLISGQTPTLLRLAAAPGSPAGA